MKMIEEDAIKIARKRLEDAGHDLLRAYSDRISRKYWELSEDQRLVLISDLERIAGRDYSSKSQLSPSIKDGVFNRSQAKDIREQLGLQQSDVGLQLGISVFAISRYERGVTVPKPKNKTGKRYLEWLKEKGYNPYNL